MHRIHAIQSIQASSRSEEVQGKLAVLVSLAEKYGQECIEANQPMITDVTSLLEAVMVMLSEALLLRALQLPNAEDRKASVVLQMKRMTNKVKPRAIDATILNAASQATRT
ncbi:unnamed protein product [Symbiodinium sp. CCMP2456]|nr:unnamed protein product [Symbiodinium sp. CCMP2456]